MKRALIGLSALALSVACTEGGRSVVLVDLSAGASVTTAIDSVIVHVTQAGKPIHHADMAGPLPLKVGVYLPKEVSGSVDIEVCAFRDFNGTREVVQVSNDPATATVIVTPGATVGPAHIVLEPRTPPAVCGGTNTGRGGSGGGPGGASGTGGAGGSTVGGTGGGGVAGTGGIGGGAAGTGGIGGTSSLAGRGGTTGIAGRGGTTGAAGTGGTGTVSDWRGQLPVSASSMYADKNPSVAVAPNGRAVVVFERDGQIYASCYDPSGPSWSGAIPIGNAGVYQMPVVAVDGVGRFTAMWTQGVGSGFPSGAWYATTSTNCADWTGGQNALSQVFASQAALAVNGDGLAVAAWVESGYVNARLRSSATSDWGAAQALQFGNNVQLPAVAMGTVGAFAVWQQAGSASLDTIFFNWATPSTGGGWKTVTPVPTDTSSRAYAPAIAVNGNNLIVTYLHQKSTTVELWARRWSGGSFEPAAEMVSSASSIDATVPPSVTLEDDGTATVVWAAPTGTLLQVQASRAAASSTTWSTVALESDNQAISGMGASQAPMPRVRGDGKGNVFVIWRKRGTGSAIFDLFARRYTPGTIGPEMKIDAIDLIGGAAASVQSPVLGMNGSGVAVAAWYYDVASPDVYANVSR